MNETITVYVDEPNEDTSLIMQQVINILNQENIAITEVKNKGGENNKSVFVASILIPVALGITSSVIYDIIKLAAKRINKHIKGSQSIKIRTSKQDGSNYETIFKIRHDE